MYKVFTYLVVPPILLLTCLYVKLTSYTMGYQDETG